MKCQESIKQKNIHYSFLLRLVLAYSTAIVLFMTNKQEAQINVHAQMMNLASQYKKGQITKSELSAEIISAIAGYSAELAE